MPLPRTVNAAKLSAENLLHAPDVSLEDSIHSALAAGVMAGEVTDYQHSNPGDGERWLVWGVGYEYRFTTLEARAFILGLQAAFRAETKR